VCAVPVFVIMYDETQQVCPVEAATADEAREIIAERLGKDVGHCPIYNADNDEDVEAILGVLRAHGAI
jgi:hypothetical protein